VACVRETEGKECSMATRVTRRFDREDTSAAPEDEDGSAPAKQGTKVQTGPTCALGATRRDGWRLEIEVSEDESEA
jgi:hypothetical protein